MLYQASRPADGPIVTVVILFFVSANWPQPQPTPPREGQQWCTELAPALSAIALDQLASQLANGSCARKMSLGKSGFPMPTSFHLVPPSAPEVSDVAAKHVRHDLTAEISSDLNTYQNVNANASLVQSKELRIKWDWVAWIVECPVLEPQIPRTNKPTVGQILWD